MTIRVYRVRPDGTREVTHPQTTVDPATTGPPPFFGYPKCQCPRCRLVVTR
ncbi:hypothetical protein [Streptomyces sp. NPDC050856]|uniref:hypothetical protein n=1 Tax=Streptomyces sp. NPDC050856 TaxID=3154939 RepID=UPI00340E1540